MERPREVDRDRLFTVLGQGYRFLGESNVRVLQTSVGVVGRTSNGGPPWGTIAVRGPPVAHRTRGPSLKPHQGVSTVYILARSAVRNGVSKKTSRSLVVGTNMTGGSPRGPGGSKPPDFRGFPHEKHSRSLPTRWKSIEQGTGDRKS